MQNFELQYSSALRNILENGIESKDRTNTGTLRLPDGLNLRLSPNVEFPALRGKKLNIRNSLIECIWMLKGLSNIKFLQENGVNYWNQWADEHGYIGPCYGSQLRYFNKGINQHVLSTIDKNDDYTGVFMKYQDMFIIDQVKELISNIIYNPESRRLILTFWNPSETKLQNLPPCYLSMQFVVIDDTLHLHSTQRSGDMFLGVPYDMMNFSIFLMIFAYITGKTPGNVYHKINDAHIYLNHREQCEKYLKVLKDSSNKMPVYDEILDTSTLFRVTYPVECERPKDFDIFLLMSEELKFNNFLIQDYNSYPFIKAEVSV